MLLDLQRHVPLGVDAADAAVVVPGGEPQPDGRLPERRLTFQGEEVFDLTFWCGTCPALFQRLADPLRADPRPADLLLAADRLGTGLDAIDDGVRQLYGTVLPRSEYTVLLLEFEPRLVAPGDAGDYYAGEQVATWGIDPSVGTPQDPGTAYYRTLETTVDAHRRLFEFVVPMVPPEWNEAARVADYVDHGSSKSTAVAYSLFDVVEPASGNGVEHYQHWTLTHFLLDGHHKVAAAARAGRPVRLLSFLDEGTSLATADAIETMVEKRRGHRSREPGATR